MNYRLLKITSFYKSFLFHYYSSNPEITNKNYSLQYQDLMKQGYGWADFFQKHFAQLGIETFEIIHNAEPLQNSWAKEFGYNKKSDIIFNQILFYKPDVIFFQDIISFNADYIKRIRENAPFVKLIIGHCCTPFSEENIKTFSNLDLLLTCSPFFLQKFKTLGIKTRLFYHAFEESLLELIQINNHFPENELLFIGSFKQSQEFHDSRLLFVEEFLKSNLPLKIYTNLTEESNFNFYGKLFSYYIVNQLKRNFLGKILLRVPKFKKIALLNSPPKKQYFSKKFREHSKNQTLYGLDMLKLLSKSKIGFNIHGGGAGDYAANARLFEVTGVGSTLLTDHKLNINDLFIPDYEIVTYKSLPECIEKARWLLDHPFECKKIAEAGQKRTLKDHSIKKRVEELDSILQTLLLNN